MVRIHTKSGKTTGATLSHSFLKRVINGVAPVLGSDLKEGDRVPVARVIPVVENAMKHTVIGTQKYDLTRDLGWLCGAYIADGSINGGNTKISKVIPEYQAKLYEIAGQLFGVELRQYPRAHNGPRMLNGWDMSKYEGMENVIPHKPLAEWLGENFGRGSFHKQVPGWVYASNIEFIRGVLGGYFDGDGNVNDLDGKQMIRTGSVSEKLTEDIILLLAYTGIFASKCREMHKKEKDRNDIHTAQVSRKYAPRFKEEIGFIVKDKAAALDNIIKYCDAAEERHDVKEMIDMIPELGPVLAHVGKALRLDGQSRLYGRFQKKEAIGRRTLAKYMPIFEDGLTQREADYKEMVASTNAALAHMRAALAAKPAGAKYVDFQGEFADLGGVIAKLANSVKLRTPYMQYAKMARIGSDTLAKYTDKLQAAAVELLADERSSLDSVPPALDLLRQALNADVVWDEIVRLEYLEDPKEYVYDFTVPGNDSFMVDVGVLVHNTLNSVEYHTDLLLKVNGELKKTKIGKYIDARVEQARAAAEAGDKALLEQHPNDTWLAHIKDADVQVLSCDEQGRISWRRVEAVTKHPVVNRDGSDTLVHVKTRSGREVIATKAKSFLKRVDNKVLPVDGEELRVGDRLPVSTELGIDDPVELAQYEAVEGYVPDVVLSSGTLALIHRDKVPELLLATDHAGDHAVLEGVLTEQVLWDEVVSIEEVRSEHPYVYDLTVEGTRNFNLFNGLAVRDTFHSAGISSASKAVRGVPRLQELLSCSKAIKTPAMTIHVHPDIRRNAPTKEAYKLACLNVLNQLRTVRFKDVVTASRIYFDPDDFNTRVPEDRGFVDLYRRFLEVDGGAASRSVSPWLLRLELDRAKMLELGLLMVDVHTVLEEFYGDRMECMFSDDNSENMVMRVKQTTDGTEDPDDLLTELKALEHNIMETVAIRGVQRIEKVSMREQSRQVYNPETGAFEKINEWVIDTDGSNLRAVLANKNVDPLLTTTNNVYEVYETLGIEAAKTVLHREIMEVLSGINVNFRHLSLLIDTMTNKGVLMPINRHGINRGDAGPLAKCSFEESTVQLVNAGVFGEVDRVNGVSSNVMLGQIAPCGTGESHVLLDEKVMQENVSRLLDAAMAKAAAQQQRQQQRAPAQGAEDVAAQCAPQNLSFAFELPAVAAPVAPKKALKVSFV